MRKSSYSWSLADAKARLSSVVERALHEGPQVITRRGRPTVVVVSAREWSRSRAPVGKLSEFLSRSPLKSLRLDLHRLQDGPRPLDL
jgi:prevent-host-death family protein